MTLRHMQALYKIRLMITTQAFADLCGTTKRTIIYYDRIGLLEPSSHRGRNRLYQPKQVLTFQKILLLKSFGLTLTEIKNYLHKSKALRQLFLRQQSQLEVQKAILEKRIARLKEFSSNLKKGRLLVVPKIKKVKPYVVYGIERIGRYVDIEKYQKQVFTLIGDTEFKRTGITIFYNLDFSPEKARIFTGIVDENKAIRRIKGLKAIEIPPYKAVSYIYVGPYSYMSYIWQFLDKYIQENKLKRNPKLKDRELYIVGRLKEPNEENLVTELQIPIL
jgi:DNA-binding transcriptional MerR regulator